MSRSQSLRYTSLRPWLNGIACWASVALPLVCGSSAFGDGGLLASTGVIGLASSLGTLNDAEIQVVDARLQNEARMARAAVLDIQEVIPNRPRAAAPSPSEAGIRASTFRSARSRIAGEPRTAPQPSAPSAAANRVVPVQPSAKAPAQNQGQRPEVTRPVTGDRPAAPFGRLLSQVRY